MAMRAPAIQAKPQPTEHPPIVRIPGISGGGPLVKGIQCLFGPSFFINEAGATMEEILEAYPHLSVAAAYDAISYYLDYQEE